MPKASSTQQVNEQWLSQACPFSVTSATGAPVAVVELSAQLTPSEREALEKAVSPDYLEDRGLKEGSHGEIVNERGRTIFEVGFAWAIRRVLGV